MILFYFEYFFIQKKDFVEIKLLNPHQESRNYNEPVTQLNP